MTKDEEYLNLLAIFHYIVAALGALFACFPILHLVIGLTLLFAPDSPGGPGGPGGIPKAFAVIFIVFPLVFILAGWTFAGLLAYAGMSLKQRTRHTFCLVMAALACMFFPFGTVLGVFTIIMLVKPEVKELFGVAEAQATPAGVAPAPGGPGGDGGDGIDRSGRRAD